MMSVDFSNSKVAFSRYSDRDLQKAAWLFRFIKHPANVKFGKFLLKVAMTIRFPIGWIVKPTVFRQFCGGETIEHCAVTIQSLAAMGVGSIPDYSAEGLGTETHFDKVKNEVLSVIELAKGKAEIPFCVFKPSGILSTLLLQKVTGGIPLNSQEHAEYERGKNRFYDLCNAAAAAQVRILVDAEESWIQGAIDSLVEEMMLRHNTSEAIVFQTVQLYRNDRLAYLKNLCARCETQRIFAGFKIVRGAYMEKERQRADAEGRLSPIYPDKSATDRAYNAAITYCMGRSARTAICLGTHNEESCLLLTHLMQELGYGTHHKYIWFAQLLGMSDHITFNLVHNGYNAIKYVPYAPVNLMMPYLLRRAAENTAVAGQTTRELEMIRKELARRAETKS
jgi:proline dehydrogenase